MYHSNKGEEESTYECEHCKEQTKVYRMFDIDGNSLVEALVYLSCILN